MIGRSDAEGEEAIFVAVTVKFVSSSLLGYMLSLGKGIQFHLYDEDKEIVFVESPCLSAWLIIYNKIRHVWAPHAVGSLIITDGTAGVRSSSPRRSTLK